MSNKQEKFTREKTLKEYKVRLEAEKKRRTRIADFFSTRMFDFLSLGLLLIAILISILPIGISLFVNDEFSKIIEKPIFIWAISWVVILLLIIGFAPKVQRWLSGPTDKEIRLKEQIIKEQIISAYSKLLDKTILNPNNKKITA